MENYWFTHLRPLHELTDRRTKGRTGRLAVRVPYSKANQPMNINLLCTVGSRYKDTVGIR